MRAALFLSATLFVLAGCVSHDYVGEQYASTERVQVFYDGNVPAGYRVMGQDRAEATEYMSTEMIVQDMIKKAREVGADAIVISGIETVNVGGTTSTYGRDLGETEYYVTEDGELHTRHKGTGKWMENSYTVAQRDKIVTAKFLKKQ